MGFMDQLLGCQMPQAHGYLQQQVSIQQQIMAQRFAAGLPPPYYDNTGRFGFLNTEEAKKRLEEPLDSKPKDEITEYEEFEQLCNHKFHELLKKFNQLKEEIE